MSNYVPNTCLDDSGELKRLIGKKAEDLPKTIINFIPLLKHMFHKRNDLELVEAIRTSPAHLRKLAEITKIPTATAYRILTRLRKEYVVDYERQGKNTVYHIRQSAEARCYLIMNEQYKTQKQVKKKEIRFIVNQIKPEHGVVILFGSYATNHEHKDSDIDLYIEHKKDFQHRKLHLHSGPLRKDSVLGKEIDKKRVILQGADAWIPR